MTVGRFTVMPSLIISYYHVSFIITYEYIHIMGFEVLTAVEIQVKVFRL